MNIFDFFQKCENDEEVVWGSRGIYVICEREDHSQDRVYSLWGPPQRFAGEFNKIVSPSERYGIEVTDCGYDQVIERIVLEEKNGHFVEHHIFPKGGYGKEWPAGMTPEQIFAEIYEGPKYDPDLFQGPGKDC